MPMTHQTLRIRLAIGRLTAGCLVSFVAGPVRSLWAQAVPHGAVSDSEPRTTASAARLPSAEWEPARASMRGLLRHTITLDLRGATIDDALQEVGRAAGIRVYAGPDAHEARGRVSLHAENLTVSDALMHVLEGTRLEAFVSLRGNAVLVRRADPEPVSRLRGQAGGTITGAVTDAVTRGPLNQVAVRVEGSGLGAMTASDGRYAVHNLPSGTYRLTARRVGYTPLTKTVAISADSVVVADFALAAAPARLNEMVTTAVGDQRRYEVGNDISTINADSIAATAPITSLTDLISARAPGVEVLETSGLAGSGQAIRIEGLTSLVLQNDPILIVDGVRQDNSAGSDVFATFFASGVNHPTPTRLNDLDFNDIASIDVLKGPAASTEYGTDAANGVIVITTKHGTAGRPHWRVSAERTESTIPGSFPNGYYSWGHTTDGTNTPVNCTLTPYSISGYGSSAHTCAVDSVTRWNPLNHTATSIFGTGNRGKYDLSVSGGSEAVRYFVSGGLSNEIGVIQMPPVFRELADTAGLGLPSSALNPNREQQRSVRANTAIKLAPTADLGLLGSYLSTYQQTPNALYLASAPSQARALSDATHNYGYGSAYFTPIASLTETGSQSTNRLAGGVTASWRPASWFTGHGTIGLDHGSQRHEALNYPLANPVYAIIVPPFLGLADATTDVYSVDLRGTATASLTEALRAVTSVGLQMVDARAAGQSAYSSTITATNLTLNGASSPVVAQQGNRQATLGGYGEEQLSIADRLFLTGAIRIDAASGFGNAYSTAAYPKTSASWLALDRGGTTVRLRAAFGESGVQPANGAAQTLYSLATTPRGGTPTTVTVLQWPGNPHLRPERTAEFEGGIDIGAWGNRVNLGLTAYSKTTHDALVNVALDGDVCCYTYQENVGSVRNRGMEGSVTATLLQNRLVTWAVGINASANENKLLSLTRGVAAQIAGNAYVAQYRQAVGYPLYGIWAQHATYVDANHDGILETTEVTVADSDTFTGSSAPTREASASTHLTLWRGAVTLGGLVDYRGGYKIVNALPSNADYDGNTRGANDPSAPLWMQARAIANYSTGSALDVEDGDFIRMREVSVTYAVPRDFVRTLRMQSVAITAAVRNLALWTRYTGKDPEVTNNVNPSFNPTAGGYVVNNDIRIDYGAVPLLRCWVVRVNVEP